MILFDILGIFWKTWMISKGPKLNKYAIYAYTHGPVTGSGPSVVWP